MSEIIYFNGMRYDGIADMPSDIRLMYEKLNRFIVDENEDGIPDMIQSGGLEGIKETVNMIKDIAQISASEGLDSGQISLVRETNSGIFINGKQYSSTTEMPDTIRNEYQRIVTSAQDGTEHIYDESWRQVDRSEYFDPHDDEILNERISKSDSFTASPIQTVDSNRRFILAASVAILILGCFVALWFLIF